jgi:hypothetical protein
MSMSYEQARSSSDSLMRGSDVFHNYAASQFRVIAAASIASINSIFTGSLSWPRLEQLENK